MGPGSELPESTSPDLHLCHPTPDECVKISTYTSAAWKDSLTVPVYLQESDVLATVPLAKDGGLTSWALVDKNQAPNQRHILCSCESFRKRALTSDASGNVEDVIIHGIASVFCAPQYRRRGYATRHMKELGEILRNWQLEHGRCIGSILYSDIGKKYYAELGWTPNRSNFHLRFPTFQADWPDLTRPVFGKDLEQLCKRDEAHVRYALAQPEPLIRRRVTILPDLDHMLWHIRKEEFGTKYLFDEIAGEKGVIAGNPGRVAWAVWTRRYYDHPDGESPDNVLYILRLVVEGDSTANQVYPHNDEELEAEEAVDDQQASAVRAVLQAAQAEATKWKLQHIELWEPSPLVRNIVRQSGFSCEEVEREDKSIASGMWYMGNGDELVEAPAWINNEHYAWC